MVWSSRSSNAVQGTSAPNSHSLGPANSHDHGHGHTATYQRKSHTYRETTSAMESRVAHRLNSNVVCVVDPYSRKLEVPRNFLHETHALHRVGIPSLCMLYLDGRCRAGTLCHQAHVDLEIIEFLRKEALSVPTCCHEHGDSHSAEVVQLIGDRTIWLNGQEIPARSFAGTLGLQRLIRESTGKDVELLARFICRLHLSNKCRYVEECNHVHMCRDYRELVIPNDLSCQPCRGGDLSGSLSHNNLSSLNNLNTNSSATDTSSTGVSTPPSYEPNTPPANAGVKWVHSPYQWRVLEEYDYTSTEYVNTLAFVPVSPTQSFGLIWTVPALRMT